MIFTTKKGFTLIEVLVATSIFAMIMIITMGTVAQSSTYRSKLKTMREVNEETRMLADQITRDVRSAGSQARINAWDLDVTPAGGAIKTFKNGLAILNCSASTCMFVNKSSSSGTVNNGSPFAVPDSLNANTLIIATKDSYKIYVLANDNKSIYYVSVSLSTTLQWSTINSYRIAANKINSNETAINFGGFCPDDSNTSSVEQPYVQFYISSRTVGYDSMPPGQRALAELRSTVTGRSYNN